MKKIYTWLRSQPLEWLILFIFLAILIIPALLFFGYKVVWAPLVALIGMIGQRALVDEPATPPTERDKILDKSQALVKKAASDYTKLELAIRKRKVLLMAKEKSEQEETKKRSEDGDPDALRRELLEGAREINGGADEQH